ncbi:MAG TPA: ATP synthase F1 subunit epsilon [Bacteroidia bacterium]|jgi:F-type H+-transporting ATPase subunit epsilon|nr:ATP synthase F1 subunit epsilon [Bacteroidia bacterium]
MHLDIITPDKQLYSGEVKSVQLPGLNGKFGVLNRHASMISALEKGTIKVVDNASQTQKFEINGGVAEVHKNKIIVLAE